MAAPSLAEISVKFTVDQRDAVNGFLNYEKRIKRLLQVKKTLEAAQGDTSEIDAEIAALRDLQLELAKTSNLSGNFGKTNKKMTEDMNAATEGSGKMSQAFGQAAFGVEDFFAGFETGGLKGGLRGAANNFSMVARILAGPLAGGMIGIGLVSIPLLVKAFGGAKEATDDWAASLENLIKVKQRQIDQFDKEKDHEKEIQNLKEETGSVAALTKKLEELETEREKALNFLKKQKELREGLATAKGVNPIDFGFAGGKQILSDEINEALGIGGLADGTGLLAGEETKKIAEQLKSDLQAAIDIAAQSLESTPENAVSIGKVLAADYDRAFDAAQAELRRTGGDGPAGLFAQLAGLEGVQHGLGLDHAVDSSLAVLNNLENLQEIQDKARESSEQSVEKQDELVKMTEKEKTLREEILQAREREAAVAQESLDELIIAGQSPLQQIIQKVVDERKKLEEIFDKTSGSPEAQDALLRASNASLSRHLDSLKKQVEKNNKIISSKGLSVSGPNKRETAALATILAKSQMEKAKDDTDKNKDVVDAITHLEDVMANRTILAVPSP